MKAGRSLPCLFHLNVDKIVGDQLGDVWGEVVGGDDLQVAGCLGEGLCCLLLIEFIVFVCHRAHRSFSASISKHPCEGVLFDSLLK